MWPNRPQMYRDFHCFMLCFPMIGHVAAACYKHVTLRTNLHFIRMLIVVVHCSSVTRVEWLFAWSTFFQVQREARVFHLNIVIFLKIFSCDWCPNLRWTLSLKFIFFGLPIQIIASFVMQRLTFRSRILSNIFSNEFPLTFGDCSTAFDSEHWPSSSCSICTSFVFRYKNYYDVRKWSFFVILLQSRKCTSWKIFYYLSNTFCCGANSCGKGKFLWAVMKCTRKFPFVANFVKHSVHFSMFSLRWTSL